MSDQPIRTWRLRHATDGALCAFEQRDGAGEDVVQLEPMLDLLEVAVRARIACAVGFGEGEQLEASDPGVAFLREHGKLDRLDLVDPREQAPPSTTEGER